MTPMQKSTIRAISVVLATIAVLYLSAKIAGAQDGITVTVERLVDGDTFHTAEGWCTPWVACKDTVRIFGIDTPESRNGGGLSGAKCIKELKLGKIAKEWARETLEGKTVIINPLPKDEQSDPRGRILATVTLPDGKDYATEAKRLGHAREYLIVDGNYQKSDWCK